MSDASQHAPSLDEDSDRLARDYEEVSRNRQFQSGQRLVSALAIAAGERVLDVGCGTGLLAEYIAGIVGPIGHVLGIDPLPLRIAWAHATARPNLEFAVGQAADLSTLPDASVDVVCLNAVFHWLPDKAGPLREFVRVLRPGGRLGIAGGAKEQRSPLRGVMRQVLAQPPFAQHPRKAAELSTRVDADEMRELLQAAGFEVVSIDLYDSPFNHASAEAVVRFSEASSFGNLLAHLPSELRPAARAALVAALAPLAGPDGSIAQHGQRMIALARKPTA
jgi:ubiquinone/menaquinone biosynthesis C-methylase UbiE